MIALIKLIALILAEFGVYAYMQIVFSELQPVILRRKHDKDIKTIQR